MIKMDAQTVQLVGVVLEAVVTLAAMFLVPAFKAWLLARESEALAAAGKDNVAKARELIGAWTIQAEKYNVTGQLAAYADSKFEFVKNKAIAAFPDLPVGDLIAIIEKEVHDNFNWDEFLTPIEQAEKQAIEASVKSE
jgi:hypothetical protein